MNREPAAKPLRVVLDTNIYVAAFGQPHGRNARIWGAARHRRFQLLVSPAIIRELARVLRSGFGWPEGRLDRRIRLISHIAQLVTPRGALDLVDADPDDNRILECAVDGGADLIVSNDHHLLDMKTCLSIPIVAGPDFRRILGLS